MNQPQSIAATDELQFGYAPNSDSPETEDLDQETLLALEMIRDDQIRISWMQDRPALEADA